MNEYYGFWASIDKCVVRLKLTQENSILILLEQSDYIPHNVYLPAALSWGETALVQSKWLCKNLSKINQDHVEPNNGTNLEKVCSEQWANRLLQYHDLHDCTKLYLPLNVPRHKDVSLYWFDAHLVGWEGEQINAFLQTRYTKIITENKYKNPEICKALKIRPFWFDISSSTIALFIPNPKK